MNNPYFPYDPRLSETGVAQTMSQQELAELEARDYTPKYEVGDELWYVWLWGCVPNGKTTEKHTRKVKVLSWTISRDFNDMSRGVLYKVETNKNDKINYQTGEITEFDEYNVRDIHQDFLYRTEAEAFEKGL